MKTAIELIAQEREEQLTKHGKTIEHDIKINNQDQLIEAAWLLLAEEADFLDGQAVGDYAPTGWNKEVFSYIMSKPKIERYTIAAALIAADIDRRLNTKTEEK